MPERKTTAIRDTLQTIIMLQTIMTMDQHRITFQQNRTITATSGTCLHHAAKQAGYALRSDCGGAGTCGKCQVVIQQQKILACQTSVQCDLDVYIPAASMLPTAKEPEEKQYPNILNTTNENPSTNTDSTAKTHCQFGIALDIGTTTLVAELHDMTGTLPHHTAVRMNPQRAFGDDVISRIQKIREDKSALTALQRLIVNTIHEMIAELSQKMSIEIHNETHNIDAVVVAGNTVMQSILFGIDPSPLGVSPFKPGADTFPVCQAMDVGLNLSGTIECLPIFGGFVGGDVVAGVLVLTGLHASDEPKMFLDIGTNGEMVLAHQGKFYTAATAAGPALEGAKIEYGMPALPGAIAHVDADGGRIKVSTIDGKPPIGICGTGLIDAAAVLLEQKILLPNGRFADKKNYFELVPKAESGIGESILLTQRDVRELQLAVGAIRSGMTLLLREHHFALEDIASYYISGGFGQSLRLASAQRIGLLPSLPALKGKTERFQLCGNTSLAGARAVLFNPALKATAHRLVQNSQHYDLAIIPAFTKVFADSLGFEQTPTR